MWAIRDLVGELPKRVQETAINRVHPAFIERANLRIS